MTLRKSQISDLPPTFVPPVILVRLAWGQSRQARGPQALAASMKITFFKKTGSEKVARHPFGQVALSGGTVKHISIYGYHGFALRA